MKGYTVYAKESGMEIRTSTATKEEKGRINKEGRITLRFFNLDDSSPSMRFILTPVEAYWVYLKTVEIARSSGKSSLTHRFESADGEITSILTIEKQEKEGKNGFAINIERGEFRKQVSIDLVNFLFTGELLKNLSSVQAWSSYKTSDEYSQEEAKDDREPELFSGTDAGGEFDEEEKPSASNGNRLLGVEIEAVRKDGQGLKVNGQWFTITDQSIIEVDELLRGMRINLSYINKESGNPLINAIYLADR